MFFQIDAPPAFVVVRNRAGAAVGFVQFIRRIDQRRLDQRRRRHRVGVRALVILHKHRRRARRVRTGHARPAHEDVIIVNRQPRNRALVRRGGRCGGSNPASRRDQIRLDAAVRARPAAGKIAHGVRAVGIKPVSHRQCACDIFRCAGGNHVFGAGPGCRWFASPARRCRRRIPECKAGRPPCPRPRRAPARRIARSRCHTRPARRCPNCLTQSSPRAGRRRA